MLQLSHQDYFEGIAVQTGLIVQYQTGCIVSHRLLSDSSYRVSYPTSDRL
jgi:hypothetical protein